MPDDSLALAPSAPAALAPAPSLPASIPPSAPSIPMEAPRQASISADKMPNYSMKPAEDSRELRPGEPPRLNKDGKTSSQWLDWMTSNLPGVEPDEDQPEPAPPQLAHFGLNLPQIESALDSLANMYTGIEGAADALSEVYAVSPETYSDIVSVVVSADPTFVIGALEAQGHIAPGLFDPPRQRTLPSDLERWVPDELYETAVALPANVLYGWLAESHNTLINSLTTQAQLNELIAEERERAAADFDASLDRALDQGEANLTEVSDYYLAAHEKQLNAWRPVGQNERGNNILRVAVYVAACSDLLSDQRFHALNEHMRHWLLYGPSYRVHGQFAQAERGEQRARQFAAQLHTRLGQLVRDGIATLNATFKGTIGTEAKTKPEDAPDPEPLPRIDKTTGKATPAYLNWVARQAEKRVAVTR